MTGISENVQLLLDGSKAAKVKYTIVTFVHQVTVRILEISNLCQMYTAMQLENILFACQINFLLLKLAFQSQHRD